MGKSDKAAGAAEPATSPIGVAVLGLGNVGSEVVRIIEQTAPDLAARIGAPLELRTLYELSKVHACVSWYETPGLVSLEAALCGCALVVSEGGCTREYFGDDARYCRADDVSSIRDALYEALESPPSGDLRARISQRYTWEEAAAKTLEAYELATAKVGV